MDIGYEVSIFLVDWLPAIVGLVMGMWLKRKWLGKGRY